MKFQRLPDHVFLFFKGGIRKTAAPAGHILRRQAGQCGQHCGRSRRIAYAHLSGADDIDAIRRCLFRPFDADKDRPHSFLPAHGRFLCQIAGAPADAALQNFTSLFFVRCCNPYIDDLRINSEMGSQRRHAGEVSCHIDGLGQSHNGRSRRDPFCHNTIVSTHHNNAPSAEGVFHLSGDARQLDRCICQLSQASGRRRQ